MLYSLHDAQQRMFNHLQTMTATTRSVFTSAANPWSYTPLGRMLAAGSDVMENMLRPHDKPDWRLQQVTVRGRVVPLSIDIVHDTPFCKLLRFRRDDPGCDGDPKLLLVAPLSGHHATLLRDTVRALAVDHDVYVTDWVDAAQVPLQAGRFDLDEYIAHLITFMEALGPRPNVMAVCQPAPAALAATAILAARNAPSRPAALVLMGGPVDPAAAPTTVSKLAAERSLAWFREHCIYPVPAHLPGGGRRVYPGFLQLRAFLSMNPARHAVAQWEMFQHLVEGDGDSATAHREFYDEYLAVMDVPAEFFLQTIRSVFQRRDLPAGKMVWRGEQVNPAAIRDTALMTVEGELDDISAPGQTMAAHQLCAGIPQSMHLNYIQAGSGHYGIFSGRRWREQVKPRIADFIRAHRDGKVTS